MVKDGEHCGFWKIDLLYTILHMGKISMFHLLAENRNAPGVIGKHPHYVVLKWFKCHFKADIVTAENNFVPFVLSEQSLHYCPT